MDADGPGSKFVYTDGVMAHYRMTPGSMSGAKTMLIEQTIHIVENNIREFGVNDKRERNSARNHIASVHAELVRIYFSQGQFLKAIMHFSYAMHCFFGKWPRLSERVFFG